MPPAIIVYFMKEEFWTLSNLKVSSYFLLDRLEHINNFVTFKDLFYGLIII